MDILMARDILMDDEYATDIYGYLEDINQISYWISYWISYCINGISQITVVTVPIYPADERVPVYTIGYSIDSIDIQLDIQLISNWVI